jgi:hypothetical protein
MVMSMRTRFATLAGLLAASVNVAAQPTTITPLAPQEVTECGALFSRVRAAASASPVSVHWSTSYLAGGTRFMGVTALNLSPRNGDFVGTGRRARHSGAEPELQLGPLGNLPSPEYVTLTIGADDTIMINEVHGPYVPLCTGDRFALILSGDSVEVFNFLLPTP